MEAKDTVMTADDLRHYQVYMTSLSSMLEKQAEISFKAGVERGMDLVLKNNNMADILHQAKQEGRKEVVEWVEKHLHSSPGKCHFYRFEDYEWHKLREELAKRVGKRKNPMASSISKRHKVLLSIP